jgi:DNA polymerase
MAGMDKSAALRKLEQDMMNDASLPLASRANLVFGEGSPGCEVMFIGEAPGYNEDVERRPFVGRAGQLLRRMIREIGWREADVYITNIVKRRPPENRDPLPEEIEAYRPYLAQQIDIIAPRVIVPLGRFSMNYFLPEAKITRDQGRAFRVPARQGAGEGGGNLLVVPMFHPAAALRAPAVLQAFQETFRRLPAILRGENTIELPPARAAAPGSEPPRQPSLFA